MKKNQQITDSNISMDDYFVDDANDPFASMFNSTQNSMIGEDPSQTTKTLKKAKERSLSVLSFFFFLISGLLSLTMHIIMISKIDDLDPKYEGYMYRYVVMTPTYASYPLTYLIIQILSGFPIRFKVLLSASFGTLLLAFALVCALTIENTLVSFILVMGSYFCSYSVFTCFTGYMLTVLGKYQKFAVVLFFVGASGFNIALNSFKVAMHSIGVTFR